MVTTKIILNLETDGISPRVYFSQYDADSREIEATLFNGDQAYTVPSGSSVSFSGVKPDGTIFDVECTYSGNVVTIPVIAQMTVIAGVVNCELTIYSGTSSILGSKNMQIIIENAAVDLDKISADSLASLQQIRHDAMNSAISAANSATSALEYKNDASESATEAESYAHGGTGSRQGEDTDNARHYKQQAAGAATSAAISETNAGNSASSASTSAANAADSASAASASATQAESSANSAAVSALNASVSMDNAGVSAIAADNSATAAATSETNAANSATASAGSAQQAAGSATAAATSETNAANSATAAAGSAQQAAGSATAAAASETNAANSATAAGDSATQAAGSEQGATAAESAAAASAAAAFTSESNAATHEGNAGNYQTGAESYAHGGTGTRPGEDTDNARYYMEQARAIVGGVHPDGTTITAEQDGTLHATGKYWENNQANDLSDIAKTGEIGDGTAIDTEGRTGAAGDTVNAQTLIDNLAHMATLFEALGLSVVGGKICVTY